MPRKEKQKISQPQPPSGEGQPTLKTQHSASFQKIYTNFIQAGFTFFDVTIAFAETIGIQGSDFNVELKANVAMAPTEAKILLRILTNTLNQYEKQFGPIAVPEPFMPELL